MLSRLVGAAPGRPRAPSSATRAQAGPAPWSCAARGCHPARQRRGRTVVVRAERSFYDILGVPVAATDRDIKKAYRQKALKLHPDVNKAPDAQARFMEVKTAFSVLSDPQQRADYDRRQRAGSWGNWRPSGTGSDFGGGWGGGASAAGGPRRPKQQQEEFYGLGDLVDSLARDLSGVLSGAGRGLSGLGQGIAGSPGFVSEWLQHQAETIGSTAGGVAGWVKQRVRPGATPEDFFRDLEKEADEWTAKRSAARKDGGKDRPLSLWEELAAVGEEFVEYLESSLPSEDESAGKTPLDEYEALKRRYKMDGTEPAAGGGGAKARAQEPPRQQQQQQQARQQAPPPPKKKTADEEVDDMLAELKKKLGKA